MMSKRLDVLTAVATLVAGALPAADVHGLSNDEAAPTRVGSNGLAIVRAGDPGDATIDLSPLAYNWAHRIPVELVANDEAALDVMVTAIGDAIVADRQLGGLCDWLDAAAPSTERIAVEAGKPQRGTELILFAHYVTSSPTG